MNKNLTKEQINFYKYEKVRLGGKYNMFMQAQQAAKDAKLTMGDYSEIMKRYSIIKENILKQYTMEEFLNLAEQEL